MRLNKFLFFFILYFSLHTVFAQTFNFKNYNTLDGLPQSYVYSIVQGPKGKLYIGTGEGLTRFDGKNFSNYTVADGLAENFITTSFRDNDGNLWFGHYQGGLTKYDGNGFRKFHLGNDIQSPINVIFEDLHGGIWIGTQSDGLFRIQGNQIQSFKNIFSNKVILSLQEDERENIFIGTNEGLFICKLNDNGLLVTKKLLEDIFIQQIIKIREEKGFMIGTRDEGLYKLFPDATKEDYLVSEIEGEELIKNKNINILYEDIDQNLWISFYGEGLSKYKLIGNKIINQENFNVNSGLSNNYVKSFFIDREENIWVGTFGGGLDHLLNPIFTLYTSHHGLLSNNITAVYNDKKNNVWLSTDKGLNKLNFYSLKEKNIIKKFPFKGELLGTKINAIQEEKTGHLLLATAENGIWKFDPEKETYSKWLSISKNLHNKKINYLAKDHNNNLWIATEEGAFEYNPTTNKFRNFTMEEGLVHNNIFSIYVDSKNTVWFATHGTGLSCYKNEKIINFKSPNTSTGLDINCFTEDDSGNLWIGTYGQGVYIFNGENFTEKYTQKKGLGSNYCYSIKKDAKNNIWIGHKSGISRYDITKQSFIFYQKKEGFLVEEVNSNAVINDKIGNIWFGTVYGLLKYSIKVDKPHEVGPIVNIRRIRLFFENVDWSLYSDSLVGLDSLPYNLTLSHEKNHLTFDVIGVSLSNPEKIKYQYKLEGFEKDWSLVTNESFITYASLPPGEYTFKARAQNSFGIWSEGPVNFRFVILSPFWKTWWFILLSILVTIGLITLIIHLRIQSLQKQKQILQNEKLKLEAEIRERKLAERRQKTTERKLKQTNEELNTFIYRSSHDLRGPLSTVKGLTQLGVMEVKEPAALKYFGLITDRINRLDTILKDLINVVEIIESDITPTLIDFDEIIKEILTDLDNSHIHKKIRLIKNITLTEPFYSDKKLVSTTFKYIVDNSIKYMSPDKDDACIEISITDIRDGVKITFADNGMGISEDIQHKVFDMFFRGTEFSKGSGLGLYITKKVVNNKLNGSLRLESIYLKSTKIECYLPSLDKFEMPAE